MGVAVGEGVFRRLDPEVDPAQVGARGGASRARGEARRSRGRQRPQDVQDLEADDARAVGRVRRRRDAAIVEGERRLPGRRVRREVLRRARRARGAEPRRLARGDVAVIEVRQPGAGEPLKRRGKRRQADALARAPGPPCRPIDRVEPLGERAQLDVEDTPGQFDRADEELVGREAVPGQLDGGGEDCVHRQAPPAGMRVGPRSDRAGDGDRERTAEWEHGEPAGPERGRIDAARSTSRPVERGLRGGRLVPHEPERVTAQAAGLAHHDPEDSVRGDRGVDRRPSGPEDAEARGGGEVVRCDNGPGTAAGQRGGRQRSDGIHRPAF